MKKKSKVFEANTVEKVSETTNRWLHVNRPKVGYTDLKIRADFKGPRKKMTVTWMSQE